MNMYTSFVVQRTLLSCPTINIFGCFLNVMNQIRRSFLPAVYVYIL